MISAKFQFLLRFTFLSACVCAVTFLGQLKGLSTEYSVMQFLPDDHELINLSERLIVDFGLAETEPILVTVETPNSTWFDENKIKQLRLLGSQLSELEGVSNVLSLANIESAADAGENLAVGGLLELTPPNTWEARITSDPVLFPLLISRDLSTAVLFVTADVNSTKIVPIINTITELGKNLFPQAIFRFGGVPVVQGQMAKLIGDELIRFLFLSLVAACFALLVVFKDPLAVVVPVLSIIITTLLTLEFMVFMGYSFNVLSSTVIVLLTIIVVALSTHTMLRLYKELKKSQGDQKKALSQTFTALFLPNLLTALTTAVGFFTLYFSPAELMRQYGLSVVAAVMIAWVVTSSLIFGFMSWVKFPQPRKWVSGQSSFLANLVTYRKATLLFVGAFTVAFLFWGQDIQFGGKLFNDLPKGHEVREATYHIDKNLGGLLPLNISISAKEENFWNNPEALEKVDKLTKNWRSWQGVGSVLSVPDIIRQSKNDPKGDLPQTRKQIAEVYFMFSLAEQNLMETYLTPDASSLRIGVRMEDVPAPLMKRQIERMAVMVKEEFPDLNVEYGGIAANAHELNTYLAKSLMFGFWWALLAIAALLLVVFRSPTWVIISTLPNFLPAIAILGFLGLTQIPLKPAVATVFSIALGIAFDNTVYILTRLRSYGYVDNYAVRQAIKEEGLSCFISSICLFCGFSIFLMSYFLLSQLFGLFLLLSIAVGLVGDLIFLPAVLASSTGLLQKEARHG